MLVGDALLYQQDRPQSLTIQISIFDMTGLGDRDYRRRVIARPIILLELS